MKRFILKDIREDRDFTQKDIAKVIGVTQTQYSRYEQGINEIPISKLIILSNFYDVSIDYILGLTNERERHHKSSKDGYRLKELRINNKVKQIYLADKLNITQAQYSRYETGVNNIPILNLIKLADFYNVSVDYLLSQTDVKDKYSSIE